MIEEGDTEERTFTLRTHRYYGVKLRIKGVPPCFSCGDPVHIGSAARPLICPRCDCGGGPGTEESNKHFDAMVDKYRIDKPAENP